jgi:hypothetical protein
MEEYRDDAVSTLIRDIMRCTADHRPGTREMYAAQKVLEERLGMQGIERREQLVELLEQCWYKLAHPHPDVGWFTNGDAFLEKLAAALSKCKKDVHVNHCCCLGLMYQKERKRDR